MANTRKCKRIADDSVTSASDHEEVKHVTELGEKHGDLWYRKQYLLSARMYVNHQWKCLDEEPDIPLLCGGLKKVPRKETFTDSIIGAAITFAKTLHRTPLCSSLLAHTSPIHPYPVVYLLPIGLN